MKKEQYEKCLNMLRGLNKTHLGWEKHPNAWIADIYPTENDPFVKVLKNLSDYAIMCLGGLGIPKDQQEAVSVFESAVDYIFERLDESTSSKFTYSAAEFIAKLYMDYFGFPPININVEELDEEVIEESVMTFDYGALPNGDVCRRALVDYQNRLKSLSRNNRLINFRQQKNTALTFCYPSSRQLFKMLLQGEIVTIANWERANLKQILRCKTQSCHKYMFRKYSAKTCNQPDYCAVCDKLNSRTKSMVSLAERPIFFTGEKLTIVCPNCGRKHQLNLNDFEDKQAQIVCRSCGEGLLQSYPYVPLDELKKKKIITDNTAFCDLGRAQEIAHKLISRDKNMQKNFGLHSLYMAFGFLNWTDVNGKQYRSPLLLVKVRLYQDVNKNYCIAVDGDVAEAVSINTTLEYVLSHYSRDMVVTLPVYDKTEAINQYFYLVKKEIEKFNLDWTIDEDVALSMFDHQKSQLEEEIKTHFDEYLQNSFINRLCGGASPLPDNVNDFLSGKYSICDADASQQYVIDKALCGESFILQGPPGSGKSQTITNIITEFMARGKTVLFVTQKSTARSIIYNNLKERNINGSSLVDYCLNFDTISNSIRGITKKAFKDHLNEIFNKRQTIAFSSDIDNSISESEIEEVRDQLCANKNEYLVDINGEKASVMQLIDLFAQYADKDEYDLFGIEPVNQLNIGLFCDEVEKFYCLVPEGYLDYKKHPLYGYCEQDYSAPSLKLMEEAVGYFGEVRKFFDDCVQLGIRASYVVCPQSVGSLHALYTALEKALSLPIFEQAWLENDNKKEWAVRLLTQCIELAEIADKLRAKRTNVNRYGLSDKADRLDVSLYRYLLGKKKFILLRVGNKYRTVLNEIAICRKKNNSVINYRQACELLSQIDEYQRVSREIVDFESRVNKCFLYSCEKMGIDYDWKTLCSRLTAIVKFYDDGDDKFFNDKFFELFISSKHDSTIREIAKICRHADEVCVRLKEILNSLELKFDQNLFSFSLSKFDDFEKEFNIILNNRQLLLPWIRFTAFLDTVKNNKRLLDALNVLISEGVIDFGRAKGALMRNYWTKYLNEILAQPRFKRLNSFTGFMFERNLQKFSKADVENIQSAAGRVYSVLQNRKLEVLEQKNIAMNDGAQFLKQRDTSSIREMIANNWHVFSKIKLCFMVSPLTVAQYIAPSIKFDLVIFDESSQIFVEDALAAIFRGKQVVIAGDLQQLPPVNFFRAGVQKGEDEDGEETICFASVAYSVLNESQKMLDKNYALRWHYRSYDEELITFSNRCFYNSSLLTFPNAAKYESDGIFCEYMPYDVNGCYESGTGRHININEARRVIEMLKKEIVDFPDYSIGVVAFSAAQAEFIEKLWFEYCATDDGLALTKEWTIKHKDEPLIICNLDSIQGDERDTIFISTCYGKDKDGRFNLLMLGPLMSDGGKNRLNVAITRSRHRMIVATSMRHAQLENLLTSSKGQHIDGAKTLCKFLEYIESFSTGGNKNIPQIQSTGIEECVCALLDSNGIAYVRKVGNSDCKIDIAICTGKRDEYKLGILFETTMNRANSVREYARLRDEMLQKHGWRLYHIWAIDWFRDFWGESRRLLECINKI